METVIQLNTREVLILIGAYASLVVLFGRVLVSQFEKRMAERFTAMEERVAKSDQHLLEVQRIVDNLRTELPLQYVRREDWIRFGATIDAKLDRLAEAVHQRNMREKP